MGRKRSLFFGSATALVTPFNMGEIDYRAFGEMIENQIANGTDALVVLGTTGEAPTISEEERYELISFARKQIRKRVPLIIGTGTNSTQVSIRYTKMAEELMADGILAVTPYYNKATENGLAQHYRALASSTKLPIILYNVPSRTGVNISMKVYDNLKRIDNIVAIKEASSSITYITELISKYSDYYHIYSGCDDLILPTLSLGGKGVISVISNIVPSHTHQLCKEFFQGSLSKSLELQLYLTPLIKEMFMEVNPIPIKTALSIMGACSDELRLPLCASTRKREITQILKKYCLI